MGFKNIPTGGGKTPPLDTTETTALAKLPEVKLDDFIKIIDDWEAKANSIIVTDISHTAEMDMARVGRLFIREKRIALEKKHKVLVKPHKDFIKTLGNDVKILVGRMKATEAELKDKENFKDRFDKEQLEQRTQDRNAKLAKCNVTVGMYDTVNMSDDLFERCLAKEQEAWELRKNIPPPQPEPKPEPPKQDPPPPQRTKLPSQGVATVDHLLDYADELDERMGAMPFTIPTKSKYRYIVDHVQKELTAISAYIRAECDKK